MGPNEPQPYRGDGYDPFRYAALCSIYQDQGAHPGQYTAGEASAVERQVNHDELQFFIWVFWF